MSESEVEPVGGIATTTTQLFQQDGGHLSEAKVESVGGIASEAGQVNAIVVRHLGKGWGKRWRKGTEEAK